LGVLRSRIPRARLGGRGGLRLCCARASPARDLVGWEGAALRCCARAPGGTDVGLARGCDAGEDELDAGEVLGEVVVFAQSFCDVAGEWILVGVEVLPSRPLFDADERHAASAKAVGVGSLYALASGKGIVAHREANGVLHTYVALTKPEEWIASIDFAHPKAAKARVAAEFAGWAPEFTALITEGESALVPRAIHALPSGQRWQRVPGATLLGDAAHLMRPDGEGANLAMYDGAELGRAIAAHRSDLEAALTEYEDAMFVRSANAAVEAAKTFSLCFADDNAPHGLIDFLSGGSGQTSSAPSATALSS